MPERIDCEYLKNIAREFHSSTTLNDLEPDEMYGLFLDYRRRVRRTMEGPGGTILAENMKPELDRGEEGMTLRQLLKSRCGVEVD